MAGHPEGVQAVISHFDGCKRVAFIPYAFVGDYDEALRTMKKLIPGIPFAGVHKGRHPLAALARSDGVWVMGGNSFVLADQIQAFNLIEPVREMVDSGIPYGGASAGANVAGPTICTTNDMPILRMPRSLDSFGLVPFQINPHYLDATAMPTGFRGETREARIKEFHAVNDVPVVGLREGTWLKVNGWVMRLDGGSPAVIFERGKEPRQVPPGSDLSSLLTAVPRFNVPMFGDVSL